MPEFGREKSCAEGLLRAQLKRIALSFIGIRLSLG
jgi:hypothetical protein